jgi:hypothetical protein
MTGVGACLSPRPLVGAGRNAQAYTLLGFLLVAFGLTIVSIVVATNLVGRFVDQSRRKEDRALSVIRQNFLTTVARTQTIPGSTNWQASLAPFAHLDASGLHQAGLFWGPDDSLARVMLVDANLPADLLPYRQTPTGLSGNATNLMGPAARVLLVSSTKRGLALPVSSGVVNSNSFNAIWNWQFDPVTKAPPAGWSTWTGFGEYLHVERINLANLFHQITFRSLKYGVAGPASVTNLVTDSLTSHLLYGTSLLLADTNATIKRAHVVTRDASFEFGPVTNPPPLLYYTYSELSGTVATNLGSTGPSADGRHTNGVTLGVAGPRPPTYTNYSASNTGIALDGVDDYVQGTNGLLNNLKGFTIAGWIKPTNSSLKLVDLFGQENIAQLGFTTADGKLDLWCDGGAKKLHYMYPYGAHEWHHLAGVGDGAQMFIYVDAVLAASRVAVITNFGSSATAFNVGGNVFGPGQYFPGVIDEVIVYGRALSAAEILQVYRNQPP